ncbi:MAG: hypothetical protein AAFZ07_09280 [Actinomycetota bacterium]
MSMRRTRFAAMFVAALVVAACGSDGDAAPPPDTVDQVVTSTTELPILRGSGASETTATPSDPGDDDGTITGATPPTTALAPPPAAGSSEDCAALSTLVAGPDGDVLASLEARIDGAEPELPDALRVLADAEAVEVARAAGASRLAGLLGVTCPGIERAANVTLLGGGLDVAFFGQDRALVSSAVTNVLGFPTLDTGPIDPLSAYGTCPGTQIWAIEWPDLVLLFSNDGQGPESFEFFGWRSFELEVAAPSGPPATPEGIAIGGALSDALSTYADDGASETTDVILDVPLVTVPGRYVFVGDAAGIIESIEGGLPCSE